MARDVIIVANHVENFIRIGADVNPPGVEEEWRILFVYPLYSRPLSIVPSSIIPSYENSVYSHTLSQCHQCQLHNRT